MGSLGCTLRLHGGQHIIQGYELNGGVQLAPQDLQSNDDLCQKDKQNLHVWKCHGSNDITAKSAGQPTGCQPIHLQCG